ncbi:adenylate cyclase 10 [Thermoflexales bacterium]|nr:adenylate cyclase 10 [Thermoflexales bacterium]
MICPACHFDNPPDFTFCGKCGAQMLGPESTAKSITIADLSHLRLYLSPLQNEALPPAPAWQAHHVTATLDHLTQLLDVVITYLPRQLVRTELAQLAEEQSLAAGEFLEGALLLADISGFTAMSERLSTLGREGAEQITEIVNRHFAVMLKIILEHGGDLLEFGGDGLLVFFHDSELPGSARALYTSWKMQQAMSAFRQVPTSLGDFPLQMKIGLSAGSIYMARLGTATDRQFIVTGPVVNAVVRAQLLAQAGQILLTPQVRTALDRPPSPFRFSPGPAEHFLLANLVTVPDATPFGAERLSLPQESTETPLQALRRSLIALDRLTPYLPAGLLPRLLPDPAHQLVGGEHRLTGVLFANFVGASELIERWGPDRAAEIALEFNRYFVNLQSIIARYAGVINKIDLCERGDVLMALFGTPVAHEDDAERTVRAALELQAAEKNFELAVNAPRIGVSSGVVYAGHVGSSERREYTVMGSVVNLAARLMEAAADGELLLSSAIRRKVSPFFEIADRGEIKVKGNVQPVSVFSIVGRRAQPEPVRGIRGLHAPLVGRDAERQTVRILAENAQSGRGSILSVVGEAGLGKSRLIDELRREVATAGWLCLESHCLSYQQNVSYSAFTEIVHDALGIVASDGELEAWTKLRQRVDELLLAEIAEDVLPYLAHFLNLPVSETLAERVAYLEGAALQRQVIRAVAVLLEQLARQQPLLLILDDLHLADSASLSLLERVLVSVERVPILICLLYRPERTQGIWALGQTAVRNYPRHSAEIFLHPLNVSAGEDQRLVCHLLELDALPPVLAQQIGRAEGNPFYIEEIIRTLIDGGAIVRADQRWQLTGEINVEAVPDTLQGVIMARIDRLLGEARRTLQLASVLGRTFSYLTLNGLAHAAGLAAQLDISLAALQRAGLIHEQQRTPELEYGFVQAMLRDVAYESLPVRDRRVYHRLVGRQIEESHSEDEREEVYEVLAHHYSLSDDRAAALSYLIQAGHKARSAYANKEAISFYRQAEGLAEQFGTPRDKAAIAEGLGKVRYHTGEYAEALAQFTRALPFSAEATQVADVHWQMGTVYEKRGEYEQALTNVSLGLARLAPAGTQTVETARLLTLQCRIHHQQGQFEQAIVAGEQALAIVDDTVHYQETAQAHNELGNAYEQCSQPDRAIAHYERSLLILERIGDEHGAARAYGNLAIIYYQTDLELSASYFKRTLETMQRLGDVWGEATAYQNLGIVAYARADYGRAIEHYQQSLSMKEVLGDSLGIADCHINLGEVYRAQGEVPQAIIHLEKGLTLSQQIGAHQAEAECYRQLAECYLEIDEPERAVMICKDALEHAQQIGDRKEQAIIDRVLGKTYLQLRTPSAAVAYLEHSTQILRELNREFDLALALCDYAQALKELEQKTQAQQSLQEAQLLFERLQLPQEQAKVSAALEQLAHDMAPR